MREMKTREEINVVLDRLPEVGETRFSGMTYEEGIAHALQWVIGDLSGDDDDALDYLETE